MAQADIALIGLAVMGQNLIMNMNDHGFVVCAYNRTVSKVHDFLKNEAKGSKVIGAESLEDMVSKLKKPRRIVLLVKAGQAVDDFIDKLVPLLEAGDIIIDGGNSEYRDTTRRCRSLKEKGLLFVGSGVSGGEEGARYGPSLMPGGHKEAWPHIKDIFQSIAAKVGTGEPCCDWVGDEGAGHFVKMVHNGIEYGDMQLICEAYHLMKDVLGMDHDEMAKVFDNWNKTELDSFLIEITANIFKYRDSDGTHLLPKIRDSAGQKGTGKWTAISALEYGTPVTLIGEAVFARCLSSIKDERVQASRSLSGPQGVKFNGDKAAFLEDIRKALYASKIISYAQGFMLLRQAAIEFGWTLNYGGIALMWRGGCIIRSVFLGKIKEAFDRDSELQNLLLDSFFSNAVQDCQLSFLLSLFRSHGAEQSALESSMASPCPVSPRLCPSMMVTDMRSCLPTSSRPRGITLEPTHMSCCQSPVSSSTPTGRATVEMSLLHPTMLKNHLHNMQEYKQDGRRRTRGSYL
ncbi:6-phosphogluconate dehydrogenase, decarboxylating isoform X1 [Scomber scombrus]|uniref:6-phosphogluconate dehydrogenase, decarboxylating isoform X1 n=1 Tax=Scomber scombrus TaxID=13677 RepID=UPI002DD8FE1E|nr:6-phosphogluconate dehydrogenase, decarboxylating isoform X1 [Scomber scombrus]